VKIGPVDPEIIVLQVLQAITKNTEIDTSKIYSSVGMFAERAKLSDMSYLLHMNLAGILCALYDS